MKPGRLICILCALLTQLFLPPDARGTETNSPAAKLKPCFRCFPIGEVQCFAKGCFRGHVDCPGPCMKASSGKWEKIPTPGHSPDELWQKFRTKDGYKAWTQAHIGEVVEIRDGDAVNVGKCKVCGGSSQVSCKTCGGRGLVKCPICDGKTYVPEDWTAFDNPRLKDRPSRFKLKDGRELIGRKISAMGSSLRIRTATGDVNVDAAELVSEEKQATQP